MYRELYYTFADRLIKANVTEQGCWLSVGRSSDKDGYTWFWFREKMTRLHRAMYIQLYGDISYDIKVRHVCDNPACFNPGHLLAGTAQDNADDKKRHGHQIYGEQVGTAKLTETMVMAILNSNATQKELAIENGVSASNIGSIINGKIWKHISRPANNPRLNRAPDKPAVMGKTRKTNPNFAETIIPACHNIVNKTRLIFSFVVSLIELSLREELDFCAKNFS